MTRVITIDAVPGTISKLTSEIPRAGVLLLPLSSDAGSGHAIETSLLQCIQNMIHKISHLKRCGDTNDTIVCIHWHDIPLYIKTAEDHFIRSFVERQFRDLTKTIDASISWKHVFLRLKPQYAFEILLEQMNDDLVSSHDVQKYTSYLDGQTYDMVLDIDHGIIDISHIRQQILQSILQVDTSKKE